MAAEASNSREPSDELITEAYAYLLGRMFVIRQEHIDAAETGFGYNQVKYNPLGSAEFVNPNLDVAYLECWFAVDDQHPALLTVPHITGRYYTAQILDEWGEVIVNINDRATPAKPSGTFALTKPGSNPPIPAGATRLDLHSAKAKMLARVELGDDLDGAVALQHQFTVTNGGSTDTVQIAPPPAITDFDNDTLAGVEIFDVVDAVLASALDVSPAAADLQLRARAVAEHVASSPQAREAVAAVVREQAAPQFKRWAMTHMAPTRHGWMGGVPAGNYASNYWMRTAANYIGLWANTGSEAIYFQAAREPDGSPLDGSNTYVIHFPPDALPDAVVEAYWSVILVSVPDYRVVPNSLNRYNLNSHSELAFEADGSLNIAIGPAPAPGVPETNWLPSPEGQPFTLTFRCYVPTSAVLPPEGTWTPPTLTRISTT